MAPLSLFRFTGKIGRLPYALESLAAFFSQHLVIIGLARAMGASVKLDAWFVLLPYRALATLSHATVWFGPSAQRPVATLEHASAVVLLTAFVYVLIVAWVLVALAFRRAADAGISEWVAAYAIAPILQISIFLILCAAPPRSEAEHGLTADNAAATRANWISVAQGVLAGIGLTVFAVAVGALVFGTYGYGMFVAMPFVVGATTGYFANRQVDIGDSRTIGLVSWATVLSGLALVATALEGAACIVMAAPLGIPVAIVGGMMGRAIALRNRRPAQTLSAVALLPLIFALEAVLPPMAAFDTVETMTVDAPPGRVWDAIVHMARIDAPLALPFRLGVAYPLGGEIVGEGVGAVRRGEFSTGTAIEQVTEWVADRKLAFTVVNDVPAMRELSPYAHVHAPHVIGYFRTTLTSFELVSLSDGRTEIIERTSHQLRLDPVFYWLPLARWIVHENNARVLDHIRRQAEQAQRRG
jgi:uncharacterized membrane protein YhaH (DUF805 family)